MRYLLGIFLFLFCLHVPAAHAQSLRVVTLYGPPYGYEVDDRVEGIAADLVREGLGRIGYEAEITIVPWKWGLEMVRVGQADAIFKALKSTEREEYLHFPEEPLVLERTVGFKADDTNVRLGQDFSGAESIRLGVGAGFIYGSPVDEIIAKNPFKKIDPAPTVERSLEKLLAGRVDVVLADKIPAVYSARRHGMVYRLETLVDEEGHEIVFSRAPTYLAFSKKTSSKDLAKRFSEALKAIKADGTYYTILKRYNVMSLDIQFEEQ
ncbi:transporter substrate-binding domain-containing protein [Pseudodesulfovibrio sp. zrk46]|uniref:substrate-binding periplasmic protein n=1 Tax=Pseudodesulfovibrio sp. zrk46 TaxID=2725288 RepID=UPI0014490010|nr:transporter substrate-binding domain-containing protein [Pseudodesulfovibrio sp. zrk46]QJB56144.1 amino acid ABC transporter substrate-binding protein [Pseudodesulfovibrio sp. zrk46]